MGGILKRKIISGRIDNFGRLLLTPSQMKYLNFIEDETAVLDFNDEGIIIAKSLGNLIAYDMMKIFQNGILIGRDICRSKMLMTDDKKIIENIEIYNDNSLKEELSEVVYYNIEFRIENDQIVIPLSKEQRQANIQIIRKIDELGRIIIPAYLRRIYNLTSETGIKIMGNKIIISNSCEQKVNINKLGMITIPEDILEFLKVKAKTEFNIESRKNITLSMIEI